MSTDWKALCAELVELDQAEPPDDFAKWRRQWTAAIKRAQAGLAQPEPEENWYPRFADWLEQEMPEGTVIGDPLWWASKIADYLARWGRPATEPETNGKA